MQSRSLDSYGASSKGLRRLGRYGREKRLDQRICRTQDLNILLMLFVKNMVFSNSMQMTLAPDVDLFGEITYIATYFATRHGDRIAADVGLDPRSIDVDLTGMKASMGVGDEVQSITPRELAARHK